MNICDKSSKRFSSKLKLIRQVDIVAMVPSLITLVALRQPQSHQSCGHWLRDGGSRSWRRRQHLGARVPREPVWEMHLWQICKTHREGDRLQDSCQWHPTKGHQTWWVMKLIIMNNKHIYLELKRVIINCFKLVLIHCYTIIFYPFLPHCRRGCTDCAEGGSWDPARPSSGWTCHTQWLKGSLDVISEREQFFFIFKTSVRIYKPVLNPCFRFYSWIIQKRKSGTLRSINPLRRLLR